MIQCIDDKSNIFAHITVDVIWFRQKLRCLVDQVCRKDTVNNTVFICFVEFLHTVCKQTECSRSENPVCFTLFQFRSASMMLSPEEIISSMMMTSFPSTEEPRNS